MPRPIRSHGGMRKFALDRPQAMSSSAIALPRAHVWRAGQLLADAGRFHCLPRMWVQVNQAWHLRHVRGVWCARTMC